jgi:hypothetical protein
MFSVVQLPLYLHMKVPHSILIVSIRNQKQITKE